jgi:hypothetical protein
MTDEPELPQDQATPRAIPASERLIVRVVYIMGILLVVMFIVLVFGIIWKATRPAPPPAPTPTIELGLTPGTTIQSTELDGDRLAIRTTDEIIVIDLRKNRIQTRIATGK